MAKNPERDLSIVPPRTLRFIDPSSSFWIHQILAPLAGGAVTAARGGLP
nr:MAG TPA: hypothetical protein [Caudoviricetes sp.]